MVLEMATANNLTGSAGDAPLLERLQSQVQADIQRNSMLQAMVGHSLDNEDSGLLTMDRRLEVKVRT